MVNSNTAINLRRDALAYVPVKVIPGIVGLLSILILTRNLAPEEYGRYSLVVTTILLFIQLAGTWLSNAMLYLFRDYAECELSGFFGYVIRFQLGIAIPALGIIYVVLVLLVGSHQLALCGMLVFFAQTIQAILLTILQCMRKILAQATVVGIQVAVQLVSLLLLIYLFDKKEVAGIHALFVGFLVGASVALLILRPSVSLFAPSPNFPKLKRRIFLYGLPMCLWFFATQFNTMGDRLFLGFYGFQSQLGGYASFRDLAAGLAAFLTMPMLMASHPLIMAAWREGVGKGDVQRMLSDGVRFVTFLFVPLIGITNTVGQDLLIALFGQRYAIGRDLMILTVLTLFVGAITMYVQRGLEVTGRTGLMSALASLTAILAFAAYFFVVPSLGVIGAASITLLAQLFYLLLVFMVVRKIVLPIVPLSFVAKMMVWLILVTMLLGSKSYIAQNYDLRLRLVLLIISVAVILFQDAKVRGICKNLAAKVINRS